MAYVNGGREKAVVRNGGHYSLFEFNKILGDFLWFLRKLPRLMQYRSMFFVFHVNVTGQLAVNSRFMRFGR